MCIKNSYCLSLTKSHFQVALKWGHWGWTLIKSVVPMRNRNLDTRIKGMDLWWHRKRPSTKQGVVRTNQPARWSQTSSVQNCENKVSLPNLRWLWQVGLTIRLSLSKKTRTCTYLCKHAYAKCFNSFFFFFKEKKAQNMLSRYGSTA